MELTEGILKAIDSSFHQSYNQIYKPAELWVVKYKGKFMQGYKFKPFSSEGRAKSFVTQFVKEIFAQGEYWQQYKANTKIHTGGYDVDYSETIKMLPQYGSTSRFDDPKNKKMFKDIATELIKSGIITIEKLL